LEEALALGGIDDRDDNFGILPVIKMGILEARVDL
jgi:hypothetical protein